MLISGESVADTTKRFMQEFCCQITITDIDRLNKRYMTGRIYYYGEPVKIDIWLSTNNRLKIGDTISIEFSGEIVNGSFSCDCIEHTQSK